MNRIEALLTHVSEECNEVGQRATKAQRFGLGEVQPGQSEHNAERMCYEMRDLITIFLMLEEEGSIPDTWYPSVEQVETKKAKVEKYLAYSRELGCVQ